MKNKLRIIDLFAGLGGIRLGVEQAFGEIGMETECLLTSEIKPYAVKTLLHNFSNDNFVGDVTQVEAETIPDFDFLLAGFPCQPFSASGKRFGFSDTRGTLFFEIERILKAKKPYGFILENVEGLVRHDLENKSDKIGRTLKTILNNLRELGYEVSYKVLDSADFGVAQSRKRIFIVGTQNHKVSLENFPVIRTTLSEVIEKGLPTMQTDFTKKLLKNYKVSELYGKAIKDKRGGKNNIHSWDIEAKGSVSMEQKNLLNRIFKERRKKKWALEHDIKWMDGMPLTLDQIKTFSDLKDLKNKLEDLTKKGYLKFEYPKDLVTEQTETGVRTYRKYKTTAAKGYNIVTGKLSFEINNILDPNDIAPTLVATDVSRIVVVDGEGVRRLTVREGLRLFGYPEWYEIPVKNTKAFDLLGNTVVVPVVKAISQRLANVYTSVQRGMDKAIPVCS